MSGAIERLADAAATRRAGKGEGRLILALAGPPAAGKSTLAAHLCAAIAARIGPGAAEVAPMDGFHLDDAILNAKGWRPRKGAPWTFDVAGFGDLLARLRAGGPAPVYAPVFDRGVEFSRNAAREFGPEVRVVVVEGNYLLLDDAPWDALAAHFDLTASIAADEALLRARLIRRWRDHGLSPEAALARAEENDLPNARLVLRRSRPAEFTLDAGG